MNNLLERWCYVPGYWRYLSLLMLALILFSASWFFVLRPEIARQEEVKKALLTLEHRQQKQQHLLQSLPGLPEINAALKEAEVQQVQLAPAFSLETLLATRGHQLMHWQPESTPRTLSLLLEWTAFQPLFTELSQAAVHLPARFLLEAKPEEQLQVQLWLEAEHASE